MGYRNDNAEVIKSLWPLIAASGGILAAIWLLGIVVNGIWCSIDEYKCFSGTVVFLWLPVIMIIFALIGALYFAALAIRDYQNRVYLEWSNPRIHRNQLNGNDRMWNATDIHMKSQGTAGLDNYAPSYSNTVKNDGATVVDDEDFDLNVIQWDKLFGGK